MLFEVWKTPEKDPVPFYDKQLNSEARWFLKWCGWLETDEHIEADDRETAWQWLREGKRSQVCK